MKVKKEGMGWIILRNLLILMGLFLILFPLYLVVINSFKTLEEAGKYSRMKRSVFVCLFMDFIASILVSALFLLFGSYIFRMFTQDPEVIKVGMKIIQVIAPSYVLFIFIEILSSALRGIGDVLIPMIMTCGGVCLLRIFWIFAVVPHIPGIQSILMSYPISWALTAVLFIIYYFIRQKKFYRSLPSEAE